MSAFKDQIAMDVAVFVNPDEFGEERTVDGVRIVAVFSDGQRDYAGADGAFRVDTFVMQARTSDLQSLPQGMPRVGRTLVVDGRSYMVSSVRGEGGMTTVEMEKGQS